MCIYTQIHTYSGQKECHDIQTCFRGQVCTAALQEGSWRARETRSILSSAFGPNTKGLRLQPCNRCVKCTAAPRGRL